LGPEELVKRENVEMFAFAFLKSGSKTYSVDFG
jgi:hypothetical protein